MYVFFIATGSRIEHDESCSTVLYKRSWKKYRRERRSQKHDMKAKVAAYNESIVNPTKAPAMEVSAGFENSYETSTPAWPW